MHRLLCAGSEQEVQPQVAAALSRACKEGVPLHVVAYKGAAAAVRLCLLAAQVLNSAQMVIVVNLSGNTAGSGVTLVMQRNAYRHNNWLMYDRCRHPGLPC